MTGKIITTHVWPPIPSRDWDWSAHHEGEEVSGPYGWGATEDEAIDDLRRLDEERAEERDDKDLLLALAGACLPKTETGK